ncbi:double-strand break repair protein MRE11 [Entomortierella parvispora]|uniref:Double-strand break repair protein n=1 Tax=Entomortierella parvispora TaxID=205924 RepID=A0A9P3H8L2_9FUNG|nr:double-strand break repair protein MRE11 [Entomortierella parvispora]
MDSQESVPSSQEQTSASQLLEGEGDDRDTLTILVATDNHLGYLERDPVRGNDSFAAFEEILALAAESEVDMVLLGGDLFHENKPSRKTMHITSKLLRKYCLGDRPVSIEFLSDPSENFPEGVESVNYMDPNLNVSLPVFSIHGNHDDPSGDGNLCALDLLAMNGLVNYFGRSQEIDNVVVKPILLQKGETRLALFGIGNIRDERLHQTFLRRNVKMMRPVEEEDKERWYNLLVLHQNRVMHGPKSYIPEAFLDEFIDLVIWGHEHECLIDPMYNPQQQFHVSQPGSSVATSLSEGESKDKHVAILKICKTKFNIQKMRLQSVRPFIMSDVTLADHQLDPNDQQKVNSFISRRVKALIEKAKEEWVAKNSQTSRKRRMYSENDSDEEEAMHDGSAPETPEIPKPLVRLRVEYSGGFEIFNPQRFGMEFVDMVANPRELVQFYRKKSGTVKNASKPAAEMDKVDVEEKLDTMRVENLVQKYLSAQNLSILAEIELADAVRVYVEKDEKDAVKDFVSTSLGRMRSVMQTKQNIELEEALLKEINKEKDSQAAKYARENPNGGLLNHKRSNTQDPDVSMDVDDEDDDANVNDESEEDRVGAKSKPKPKKAVGRGASKAATSAAAAAAAVAAATTSSRSVSKAAANSRARKDKVLAADSQDEGDDDDLFDVDEAQGSSSKRSSPSRPVRGRAAAVVLDTDEEEDNQVGQDGESEEEFVAPRRGAAAKGKGRAKSPAKAKAKPAPKAAPKRAASPKKSAAPAAAAAGTSASAPRTTTATRSQPSQASQTPSRMVLAIGSRKKKLF